MGEPHLEIIVDRLLREFKVEANVGKPQVSYRETIRKSVEAEGKYVRQSGGKGQYGHCKIRMEPQEPAKDTNLSTQPSAAVFQRNTYSPSITVLSRLLKRDLWQVTRW